MKIKILFLIQLFIFGANGFAQSADDEIVYWINSGDYLQLNQRFEEEKQNIESKTVFLLAEAYLHTAFNRPDDAIGKLNELITHHQEMLGMDGITSSILLLHENLRYQGKYHTATELIKGFVDQTDTFNGLDENVRNFLVGFYALRGLGDGMKPVIERPARDCEIPIIDNSTDSKLVEHLIHVNATINGNNVIVALDTGCDAFGTNLVTEKFARENGIQVLNDSVLLYGVAKAGYARIGKADKIIIGDITYRNVAFTIAPGDNIAPVDTLQMDAVIGSVFFKAVGECQLLSKEKKIIFPIRQTPRPSSGSYMFFRGGQPYIEAFTGEERLLMHLDTGGYLDLSGKFFAEHKDEITKSGTLKTGGGFGGFAGKKFIDKYILTDFPFEIGDQKIMVPKIDVITEEAEIPTFDGVVGSQLMEYFDKVTINFDKMYLKVE